MKEMKNSDSVPESHRGLRARYRLIMGECAKCGSKSFPPKTRCKCGSLSFKYSSKIGIARLYSFTWRNEDGDIVAPADVELEGAVIPSRVTDVESADLKIGMELEPTFRRLRQGKDGLIDYGLVFRPRSTYRQFENRRPKSSHAKAGIIGYGSYVPLYRVPIEEVAKTVKGNPAGMKKGTGVCEKAIPNYDQDAITMGVDASHRALAHAGVKGSSIASVYFGSTSRPYSIKPGAITLVEALGATPNARVQDLDGSFACAANAFIEGLACAEMLKTIVRAQNQATVAEDGAGMEVRDNILVVGADFPSAPEGDALNQTSGAGAAAFLFGTSDPIAELVSHCAYSSDIPDGWKLNVPLADMVSQGRFALEPAYFLHLTEAIKGALKMANIEGKDVAHAAIYNPASSNPARFAKAFGFTESAMVPTNLNAHVGNSGAASVMLSLAYALDRANPGENVLMATYGLGAHAEAFVFRTTEHIAEKRAYNTPLDAQLAIKKAADYGTYRRRMR